jgi:hypothetical protein
MRRPRIPWTAQQAIRGTAFLPQLATASLRMLPDFLICGGQRCGTTSTYKMLSSHPDVLPAVLLKGVHYFDTGFDHSLNWYRAHFPLRATARRREAKTGRRPITGESSPYYLFHPLAASRIASTLPGVKTIVLLRDPVERAFSAHSHELARGYESLDFESAIALEEARTRGEAKRLTADPTAQSEDLQHHAYLARGRYVEQLTRMEKAIGRDSMLVVDADDLFRDPQPAMDAMCEFLGIRPHPDRDALRKHNARDRAPMDPALRARLESYFEPYDAELADWWGRTPSWRR